MAFPTLQRQQNLMARLSPSRVTYSTSPGLLSSQHIKTLSASHDTAPQAQTPLTLLLTCEKNNNHEVRFN